MNRLTILLLPAVLCLSSLNTGAQTNILFVGNSFTQGSGYNSAGITDENGTSNGGVPGIFKKMASDLGYSCNVSIEAVSGMTLDYHYTNKSAIIGQAKWNLVVLQDYSTEPTTTAGNIAQFETSVGQLKTLITGANPNAKIMLYETWARPDLCSLGGSNVFPSLDAMLSQLRDDYYDAASVYNLYGVAPVGDAFAKAIALGYADANPYNGIDSGKFNLWGPDYYHASNYGYYLAGAVFLEKITGLDPRLIPTGSGSAANGLGIFPTYAGYLNSVAYQVASSAPVITSSNATTFNAGQTGSFAVTATGLPTATISLASGSLPPGVSLNSSGALSGTPTVAGVYLYTLQAANGFGTNSTQSFTLTVVNTYNQWSAFYLGGVNTDATASPQGDGVPNLLKYACRINPSTAMTSADRAALPTLGTASVGGTNYLALTWRKNASTTSVAYTLQVSTDCQNWTNVTPDLTQNIGLDPVTHDPLVQVGVAMTGAKKFIRMQFSMP